MHRRLVENHRTLSDFIHESERRLSEVVRPDRTTLARRRFAFACQLGPHNALVERCLQLLATDRLPQASRLVVTEHGKRLQNLRLEYNVRVGRWPLDAAMADWGGYILSTRAFHVLLEDHMAWERDMIFPVIAHALDPSVALELLGPRVEVPSTDPSSPAPRHTIDASF